MKKRLLSIIASATIVAISCVNFSAFAANGNINVQPSKTHLSVAMEQHLNQTVSVLSKGQNGISEIKELQDFNNNLYYLVECNPGYYIIEAETGMYVEYSTISEAPYKNCTGNKLYYAGPTFFYEEVNGKIVHTIEKNEILNTDTIQGAKLASANLRTELLNTAEKRIETTSKTRMSVPKVDGRNVVPYNVEPEMPTYVTGYDNLKYLGMVYRDQYGNITPESRRAAEKRLGYVDGGYCGYIAGNLLMYYWQMRLGGNYVPEAWLGSINGDVGLNGPNLTQILINYGKIRGIGAGTTPIDIYNVLCDYQDSQGFGGVVGYDYLGSYNVIAEIGRDRPSILFGYLPDPQPGATSHITHAVVAYGIYESDASIFCNYGWPGYSEVVLWGHQSMAFAGCTTYTP